MKCTADEKTMEQRRRERLGYVTLFMRPTMPDGLRGDAARDACLDLLTGWFRNSKWAVCRYVFCLALRDSWEELCLSLRLFWHYRVMRCTREETVLRVFGPDAIPEEVEEDEEWPVLL